MNNQIFSFYGQEIEFTMSNEDVMVNATEMGKIFGKRPVDFLRLTTTKAYIEDLKSSLIEFRSEDSSLLNAENRDLQEQDRSKITDSSLLKSIEVVKTEKGKGEDGGVTWMHSRLALKFASWLDVKFENWVYEVINRMTFGYMKEANDIIKIKAQILERKNEIERELYDNKLFREYIDLDKKLSRVAYQMGKTQSNQLNMFMNKN